MSPSLETRLPLEQFHRHFVATHEKDKADRIFAELAQRAVESQRPFSTLIAEWIASRYRQTAYQDNHWYAKEVRLDRCFSAHTDFRLYPIPKDQRFVDFLPSYRQEIEAGSFPCSSEIRAPWSTLMPEPLVQERGPANYYILDGQLRVIRHWYHDIQNLRVFLYKGQGSV
ncbi:MAG: hypothetical protein ABSD89_05590 [Halobacteriota archaeon]|jgi:hypothetical protein